MSGLDVERLTRALLNAQDGQTDHSERCLQTTCPVAAELLDFAPRLAAEYDRLTGLCQFKFESGLRCLAVKTHPIHHGAWFAPGNSWIGKQGRGPEPNHDFLARTDPIVAS